MNSAFAAGHLNDVERRTVTSRATGSDHDVYICKPASYLVGEQRTYPLLIVLDANYGFATAAESSRMQASTGETQELFVVGLGTPGGLQSHGVRRMRDYTPGVGQLEGQHADSEVGKLVRARLQSAGLGGEEGLGGAQRFAAFMRDELLPELFDAYSIDVSDVGLFGFSAGGALACDLLLRGDASFQKLIIGSFPINCYKAEDLASLEWQFAERASAPRVYAAFGGAEFDDPLLASLFNPSIALLERLKAAVPAFDLTLRTFEDETHSSGFTMLMASGIRKFWPSGLSFSQAAASRRAWEASKQASGR